MLMRGICTSLNGQNMETALNENISDFISLPENEAKKVTSTKQKNNKHIWNKYL